MKASSITGATLRNALLLILLFFAFSSSFQKIDNFDFWWHIKTGQYILDHKALPDKDPFTYTFLEHDSDAPEMAAVVLKSYWLSQVIFFLVFQLPGPLGIILFKSAIFILILIILWKYLLNRSASVILTVIMLTGFVIFAKEQIVERPQIFSFLFATIVFYLLENMREAKAQVEVKDRTEAEGEEANAEKTFLNLNLTLLLLPVVMLLWANMHRGYMVGMAFITVYIAGLLFNPGPGRSRFSHLIVYLISFLVAFVNPVTYHPITSFISSQGSGYRNEAFEFNPLYNVVPFLSSNWYPLFALLIISAIIVAASLAFYVLRFTLRHAQVDNVVSSPSLNSGRSLSDHPNCLPLEHLLLLIGTAIATLSSIRYAMFFMIVAVPIVTLYLSRKLRFDIPEGVRKGIIVILFFILLVLSFRSPLFTEQRSNLVDASAVPVNAVEFIQQKSLQPRVFNDINWGGYLIWKLYPEYQVFSDTRALNLEIYRQYLSILHANETMYVGVPEWKALLDMYSINTIIHSTVNPYSGEVWPLMLKLLNDSEWHLVYTDGMAAILVRKMPPGLVELPKSELLQEIRVEASQGLSRFPKNQGFRKTLETLNTIPNRDQ